MNVSSVFRANDSPRIERDDGVELSFEDELPERFEVESSRISVVERAALDLADGLVIFRSKCVALRTR